LYLQFNLISLQSIVSGVKAVDVLLDNGSKESKLIGMEGYFPVVKNLMDCVNTTLRINSLMKQLRFKEIEKLRGEFFEELKKALMISKKPHTEIKRTEFVSYRN
jgi:hypothetical protein